MAEGTRWPRDGRRRSGEGGFTLVELVVATAVLLLGLLLACDLLDESARLLHHSVRRAHDPATLHAGELLRNDLRGSSVVPASDGWVVGELVTVAPPTGAVVWRQAGDELRRRAGGHERVLLRRVRSFRWRDVGLGLVEVELELDRSGGWASPLAGALPHADAGGRERLRLVIATGVGWTGW